MSVGRENLGGFLLTCFRSRSYARLTYPMCRGAAAGTGVGVGPRREVLQERSPRRRPRSAALQCPCSEQFFYVRLFAHCEMWTPYFKSSPPLAVKRPLIGQYQIGHFIERSHWPIECIWGSQTYNQLYAFLG